MRKALVSLFAILALTGCVAPGARDRQPDPGDADQLAPTAGSSIAPAGAAVAATDLPAREPFSLPVDADIAPISLANPPADAARAFELCRIHDWVDRKGPEVIAGIGRIDRAREAVHYARLTGLEPEIQSESPAWMAQFRGEIRVDWELAFIDPTCIVVGGDGGFFGTGPVKQVGSDVTITPQPVKQEPDRALPPPQP